MVVKFDERLVVKAAFVVWVLSIVTFLLLTYFYFRSKATVLSPLVVVIFVGSIIVGTLSFIVFVFLKFVPLRYRKKVVLIFVGFALFSAGIGVGWKQGYKVGVKLPLYERYKEMCKRSQPYDAPPELLRALNLVIHKYDSSSAMSDYEKRFYRAIASCTQLGYANLESTPGEGVQGVFLAPTSTNEKLMIQVERKYAQTDDLTIALLLSHELAHAKQFVERTGIDYFSSAKTEDSLNDEVEAFRQTLYFASQLNEGEAASVLARIKMYDKNSQIAQISYLLELSNMALSSCRLETNKKTVYSDAGRSCYAGELTRGLMRMVLDLGY